MLSLLLATYLAFFPSFGEYGQAIENYRTCQDDKHFLDEHYANPLEEFEYLEIYGFHAPFFYKGHTQVEGRPVAILEWFGGGIKMVYDDYYAVPNTTEAFYVELTEKGVIFELAHQQEERLLQHYFGKKKDDH